MRVARDSLSSGDFCMLVVDDDPDQVRFVERAFSKVSSPSSHRLSICKDGEEAISYLAGDGRFADRCRSPLPSLIVLDLKLPRRGGLEVLASIRRESPVRTTPVVIFSSSVEPSDVNRAYDLGANAYLVKPLGTAELQALVRAVLEFWAGLNRLPTEAPRSPQAPGRIL